MKSAAVFTFGEYRLDAFSVICTQPHPMPLAPKASARLHYLASSAGRLVPKQEPLDAVWPGVFGGTPF
jgi:DNA-binding winged helix-turn-helix (wHTH) protein